MSTSTESNQYRFAGYNLPMIQLDETGPQYVYLATVHPYYSNQPIYWQKPTGSPDISVQSASNYRGMENPQQIEIKPKISPMLGYQKKNL